MANKGIFSKNYYIVPEAVADLDAEVYKMMAEAEIKSVDFLSYG